MIFFRFNNEFYSTRYTHNDNTQKTNMNSNESYQTGGPGSKVIAILSLIVGKLNSISNRSSS